MIDSHPFDGAKYLLTNEAQLAALKDAYECGHQTVINNALELVRRARANECESMVADEDGWSEWVHPTPPSFFSQCCDCGLVHEMEFQIVPRDASGAGMNFGETDAGVIIFRARRAITAGARRGET